MKKIFLLAISIFYITGVFAQNGKLKGKVFDAYTNNLLPEANIQVKGAGGTTTDKNGAFSIDCKAPVEITVSFVGYETYKLKVTNCNEELNIALIPTATNLNAIEITATSNPNKTQLEQPASIVRLKPVELKRGTGIYLADAVNTNIPGVFMESRTNSAGQQFNIRGYGNGVRGTNGVNSNFDGQGSKVYLNGIPVTDAEGITVMDDIDFSSISNVEVSKGPSGTLFGMAIAGVVNLETRKAAKDKVSVGEDVMFGSYGLFRSTTHVGIGGKNSSLLLNYGHQKFDGYMPHTAAHKDFVNAMGDFKLDDKQSMTLYMGYSDSYNERNGELTIQQYETKDYSGNPAYIKNNAHSAVKSFRAGLGYTYKFTGNISNTTTFFGASQKMDNSSAGGWTDKSPLSYGLRSTFDMNFNLSNSVSLSGITGIELQKTESLADGYKMTTDSTDPGGYNVIGAVKSIGATASGTASYFTQWTLALPWELSLTAGVGLSTMNLSFADRLWSSTHNQPGNTYPKEFTAKYNDMVSPAFAINKKLGRSASVYFSYSTGYKAPVSSYFYIPTTGEVNPGLKPEKGTQFELGTKGSMMEDRLFYTLAMFNATFSNKMTAVAVPNPENTATLYSYITNGGSLNNNGLELLVKYAAISSGTGFVTALNPFLNFTYSDFKYKDFTYEKIGTTVNDADSLIVVDYSGNTVAGVPPVVFNIGFDIDTKPGLYGNVNLNYRDAMYFTSDELNQTSSYTLLNAKLGYKHTFGHFGLDVYFGANNITGTQYYYMVFLNQLPDAYLAAPYEINYYGGVNLKYTF